MRFAALAAFLGALLVCGCAARKAAGISPQSSAGARLVGNAGADGKLIVTPSTVRVGKVIWVNRPGRFVVLNFPPGQMPALGQPFGLYRDGRNTGEAKITNAQDDDNVVADVLSGEAQLGDEAREN